MSAKPDTQILTANHLLSGLTVYLDRCGEWAGDIRHARIAASEAEALGMQALGKADEAANEVVGVYLVPVTVPDDGTPVPVHYRERMRARAFPSFWAAPSDIAAHEAARVSI
jgi:hypothetical protein